MQYYLVSFANSDTFLLLVDERGGFKVSSADHIFFATLFGEIIKTEL